jgi:hypothetical protein
MNIYNSIMINGDHSPISPQVASLYQRWLGKRLFSDKRLQVTNVIKWQYLRGVLVRDSSVV